MSNWDSYIPEESPKAEAGDFRCEVIAAEEGESKSSGKPMIIITVKPNGSNAKVKCYMVKNEYFNRNITSFFDSFGITRGDFNLLGWVGAVGAGKFALDDEGYLKLKWFLSPKQAEKLPEWVGEKPERQTISSLGGYGDVKPNFETVNPEDDFPFM